MTNEGIQKTTTEIITKQNAVLKNLKKLTKSNNHLYEIIPEHLPRYFFMDIDIKKEELTEEEKSYLEKNDIIEKLKEAMSAVFEVNISDVVVLYTTGQTNNCMYFNFQLSVRNFLLPGSPPPPPSQQPSRCHKGFTSAGDGEWPATRNRTDQRRLSFSQ